MREIKFRAWDKVGKRFARMPMYINSEGLLYVDGDPHGIQMDGSRGILCKPNQYEFVEMFTGIKDGKGVEIYEGDILEHPSPGRTYRYVSFEDGCFIGWAKGSEDDPSPLYTFQHWIIAGNIHQNPELL